MPDSSFSDATILLLDANALMMPFQFSIDLEGEIRRLLGSVEMAVPSSVLMELSRVSRRNRTAKAALQLASKYRSIEVKGSGDDAILRAAKELGAVVLTNDIGLKRRLREAGVPVVYLREKSRLAGEGLPLK